MVFGKNEEEARRMAAFAFARGNAAQSPWLDEELVSCRRASMLGDRPAADAKGIAFLADKPPAWEAPLRAAR